jgi:rSAM/selenodomain-associated transferase 2
MGDITIAVVVPILNEAKSLPELLQMLETLKADEVMMVDGGSTDGSDQLLISSRFKWIKSEPGRALQMNSGAGRCQSDVLLFLHADTEMPFDALTHLRDAMQNLNIVGGRFDVRLSGTRPAFRMIEWFINIRSRLTRISTGDQCQFVRRDIFELMNGFPNQPLMEDVEFSKRLKQRGRVACLRDKVTTSSRRWEQFGMIRTIVLMWKLRFLYWAGVSSERLARIYRDAR